MLMVVLIVLMLMLVAVSVAVTVTRIAARLRLERPFYDSNVQPQLVQQAVEHVIVLIRQPAGLDLQGHVPIAQVIGGARQQVPIGDIDRRQQLGASADFDYQLTVTRGQAVTVLEGEPALEQ
jgi:hypothetical protein